MTYSTQENDFLDWETLPLDGIELSVDTLERAACLAQTQAEGDRQWQLYLNALALFGFEQWLSDRATDLTVEASTDSLTPFMLPPSPLPSPPEALEPESELAIAPIQVGDFRVCLLAMGSLTDESIPLPQALLDSPDGVAHFYVLVDVLEEQEQVRIQGYFRYDQWVSRQQSSLAISPVAGSYALPLSWFAASPNTLLLELRALSPAAIPLPQSASQAQRDRSVEAGDRLSHTLDQLAQRTINTGRWLRDQLDAAAQDLNWVLMPALIPTAASGLRSSVTNPVMTVLERLRRDGAEIPPTARGAYRDLHSGDTAVRLNAIVWDVDETDTEPEWSLLLVLTTQPHARPPVGTKLIVRDNEQVLVEQAWVEDDPDAHLYAQVIGTQQEQFWVTLDFPHGVVATLPPFAFEQD